MIVEGQNVVEELLNSNYYIEKILIEKNYIDKRNIISLAKQKTIEVEEVDKELMQKMSKSKNCQGILAFVKKYSYCDIDEILEYAKAKNEPNFIIILDGIEDPHNLGAIIRTAECAGVHGIVIAKNRNCFVNETVFKTSAGAVANMKIAQVVNINQTIEKLKKQNVWVYALEAGETNIYNSDLRGNIALVVGSEGKGVSSLTKKICDGILSLPLLGHTNSLNASNAAAIGIYETLRQRTNHAK